jgi:signal transduction histidine kinase
MNDEVEIQVIDNGTGISEAIRSRIFEPFFTTKKTGQGTGQGLALSYNIVKKHGGSLTVESREGEGTTFFVRLPLQGGGV